MTVSKPPAGRCPSCNAFISGDSGFCSLCGAVLRPLRAPRLFDSRNPAGPLALILAFLGFSFCGPLAAIPALLIARKELKRAEREGTSQVNDVLVRAAYWLSIFDLVVWGALILVGIIVYGPGWSRI